MFPSLLMAISLPGVLFGIVQATDDGCHCS